MNKVFTVTEVNSYIKTMFIRDYALNQIYIKGEVSNCKYHTSGHIYFTLKDAGGQIACVMFAGQRQGLKFRMTEGQSVIALGSVNVYERDGKYQLYAREILLDGAGELYERFEQLKKILAEEGLFDQSHKQPIPKYAKKIGVVTARTGAALQDICNISKRRNPYVQLILYPAKVQGEGAAQTVVRGIRALDKLGLDTIIVGRGGGSIEDLWAFNEEIVARAIFEAKTPIISAVGHETDVTIADFAADLRAPTPSAGAELAVTDISSVYEELNRGQMRLLQLMKIKTEAGRKDLETYRMRLEFNSPMHKLRQQRQGLSDTLDRLNNCMEQKIMAKRQSIQLYIEKLNGLSPLTQLNRGYAYVSQEGQVVSSIDQVDEKNEITVSVKDGDLTAVVTSKKKMNR